MAALSAAVTVIMTVNHELDSVDQLQRVVTKLEDAAGYVVLRNAVHNDTFAIYDQSVIRKRLKKELGAKEISMAKLQPWLVEELSLKSLAITAAARDSHFHLLDRQRLQTWQRRLAISSVPLCTRLRNRVVFLANFPTEARLHRRA